MNSRLEIEDVGGYNPRDTDEWSETDEKALELLKGLNSGPVKLNPHELQMLEAKKEAPGYQPSFGLPLAQGVEEGHGSWSTNSEFPRLVIGGDEPAFWVGGSPKSWRFV